MRKRILNLTYIAIGAALMAICAWITIPIGPVPFTMQTFAVLTVAGILGWKRAVASVLAYMGLGMMGLPVFSGFGGGIGVLAGVTGGYIVGFVFTAWIVGWAADRFRRILPLALSMVAGIFLCYVFGTIWYLWIYTRSTGAVGMLSVLSVCVFPYILPDLFKAALALFLTKRLRKYIK